MPVPDLRWPRVVCVALLALVLFFGVHYLYQRYFKQEPFLEEICRLEGVADAEIIPERGGDILMLTPDSTFQGRLQGLISAVETIVSGRLRAPLRIEIKDRRSSRLDIFAIAVSPDLYEAVRWGRYRSAADRIAEAAARYDLTDEIFAVDANYLYLQARDGDSYLYLIVPLTPAREGGAADA